MTFWSEAREVLMFDGMISPEQSDFLANQLDRKVCVNYLSMGQFGGATMLVGNTLIEHRSLDRVTPSQWGWRIWWRILTARPKAQRCICGWSKPGENIEYHQAEMVNEAIAQFIRQRERDSYGNPCH